MKGLNPRPSAWQAVTACGRGAKIPCTSISRAVPCGGCLFVFHRCLPAIRTPFFAETACLWTRWVSRISRSASPAVVSAPELVLGQRAAGDAAVQCCMSLRVASSMSGSATTSETAKRPPRLRARAVSLRSCCWSPRRLMTHRGGRRRRSGRRIRVRPRRRRRGASPGHALAQARTPPPFGG